MYVEKRIAFLGAFGSTSVGEKMWKMWKMWISFRKKQGQAGESGQYKGFCEEIVEESRNALC